MNKNFIVLIIFFFLSFELKSQSLNRVKYFLIPWDAKHVVARNPSNFKLCDNYEFSNPVPHFHKYFQSPSEFVEEICKSSKIDKGSLLIAAVDFEFDTCTYTLFFDALGNYLFEGNWYTRQDWLYCELFQFFSNFFIPDVTRKVCKEE
jgi:hypothetical protein